MGLWRGRRERGAAVVAITVPAAAEVTTGRLVSIDGERLTFEDDAGETRTTDRARVFRAAPDQMARLRSLQMAERLLREQFESLLAEMEQM